MLNSRGHKHILAKVSRHKTTASSGHQFRPSVKNVTRPGKSAYVPKIHRHNQLTAEKSADNRVGAARLAGTLNDWGVRLNALKCLVSVSTAVTSFTEPVAGSVFIIVAEVCGQGQGHWGQGHARLKATAAGTV